MSNSCFFLVPYHCQLVCNIQKIENKECQHSNFWALKTKTEFKMEITIRLRFGLITRVQKQNGI